MVILCKSSGPIAHSQAMVFIFTQRNIVVMVKAYAHEWPGTSDTHMLAGVHERVDQWIPFKMEDERIAQA